MPTKFKVLDRPQAVTPPPAEPGSGTIPALGSPLEWRNDEATRTIFGHLRGHPETTLFFIRVCDDRADRGDLSGAFIPDDEEGENYLKRGLISFLKIRAVSYFREFQRKALGLDGELEATKIRLQYAVDACERIMDAINGHTDWSPDYHVDEPNWNPQAHIEPTITVADCRALKAVLIENGRMDESGAMLAKENNQALPEGGAR